METRANHVLIGAFVLLALAGMLGFAVWKSDLANTPDRRSYSILFEGPVRGLSTASDVLFNGLKVGKIKRVRIAPEDSRLVEVVVWVLPDTPVRANSKASIGQSGLAALATVQISPGTPDAALVPGTITAPFPYIPADRGLGATSLLEAAPQALSNANSAFERLNTILADNQQSIRASVKSVEDFAKVLQDNREDVANLIHNARTVSEDMTKLRGLMEQASATLGRIDGVIARTEGPLTATLKNAEAVSGALAERKDDLATTIANARELSEQFKQVTAKLSGSIRPMACCRAPTISP
jgi:phospholipid/cholesterol/gamma-HCH transport system substrate-binding protein